MAAKLISANVGWFIVAVAPIGIALALIRTPERIVPEVAGERFGLRDYWQSKRGPRDTKTGGSGKVAQFLKLASNAGEVRRFDYDLRLCAIKVPQGGWEPPAAARSVRGHKRLTYNRRASPWRQLMEMTATEHGGS